MPDILISNVKTPKSHFISKLGVGIREYFGEFYLMIKKKSILSWFF
jgi:hypothetical protein